MPPKPAKSAAERPPKTDLARVGLFKEEQYMHGEPPYIPLDNFEWNEEAHKGQQILTKISGPKDGSNRGYFTKFTRLFDKECVTEPLKEYRKRRKAAKEKYYAGEFIYASPGKKLLGSGNYWGTFRGQIEAFSPAVRDEIKVPEKKNVRIEPPKQGSGYGFADCTMNPYPPALAQDPETKKRVIKSKVQMGRPIFYYYGSKPDYLQKNPYHVSRDLMARLATKRQRRRRHFDFTYVIPFKPTGKGKTLGGCKCGCFTPFSEFSTTAATVKLPKLRKVAPIVTLGSKSSTFVSTLQTNIQKVVTPQTYKDVEGVMYIRQESATTRRSIAV